MTQVNNNTSNNSSSSNNSQASKLASKHDITEQEAQELLDDGWTPAQIDAAVGDGFKIKDIIDLASDQGISGSEFKQLQSLGFDSVSEMKEFVTEWTTKPGGSNLTVEQMVALDRAGFKSSDVTNGRSVNDFVEMVEMGYTRSDVSVGGSSTGDINQESFDVVSRLARNDVSRDEYSTLKNLGFSNDDLNQLMDQGVSMNDVITLTENGYSKDDIMLGLHHGITIDEMLSSTVDDFRSALAEKMGVAFAELMQNWRDSALVKDDKSSTGDVDEVEILETLHAEYDEEQIEDLLEKGYTLDQLYEAHQEGIPLSEL